MRGKRNCNRSNVSTNLPVPVTKGKKKTPQKSKRNCKSRLTSIEKAPEHQNLPKTDNNEASSENSCSLYNIQNKENIPITFNDKEVYQKKVNINDSSYKTYPFKESNINSNCNYDNLQPLLTNNNISIENNSDYCIDTLCIPTSVGEVEAESTDDEFEFILEQELIKEQIKRNVRMSSSDDYINSLLQLSGSNAGFEEQEKLILIAIRANRKLADLCVTLEAALVKKLDKITKEVQHLKVECTNSLDDSDTMMSRGFYSQFGAPYFKDTSGFYCPRNQDFNDKVSKNQFIGYLYMQADHTADITALSNAIREYVIDDYIKKSNVEDLKKRLLDVDNLLQQEILKKEINFINSKVSFMKTVDLKYLVKDISDSDIDWMKISSRESLDILTPGECLRYWNLILSPKVNRGTWPQQEKKELKKLVIQNDYQNWDKIAKQLNSKRTGYQCFIQFKKHFGMVDFNRGRWSKKEDVQLSYLVSISEQGGVIGWAKVLCHLEDRTMAQALNRWYRLDPGLKKGKFTDEEDIILVNAVEQFGLDFQKVASVFPNRSAIQLRERYFAKRDMKVNKCGEWSLAEDKLLMDQIAVHGERKWSKIAQNFPSRNRIQIRHRYKCIKLNLQKDPGFKLENLNRFKRNTHVNSKNKRDEEAISKSTAIDIISKTIEEGKIFYNKRRILKRTGRLKERG